MSTSKPLIIDPCRLVNWWAHVEGDVEGAHKSWVTSEFVGFAGLWAVLGGAHLIFL